MRQPTKMQGKKLIMKDKIRQAEELQIKNWERTFRREKTGQQREQTEHEISGKKHGDQHEEN